MLRHNGAQGSGGFEAIGTAAEGGDLVLEKLLSYDEMGKLIVHIECNDTVMKMLYICVRDFIFIMYA